jgi:hypothetical protein
VPLKKARKKSISIPMFGHGTPWHANLDKKKKLDSFGMKNNELCIVPSYQDPYLLPYLVWALV